MKVLVWSDMHFNNWRQFSSSVGGLNSRFKEQIKVFSQIKEMAFDADCSIFGGDVFHNVRKIDVDVFNVVRDLWKDFPCPLYVVDGNHDLSIRENPEWMHRSFESLIGGDVKHLNGLGTFESLKLFGVGYADGIMGLENNYDLIVVHKEPVGAKYGNYVFQEGVNWKELEKKCKFLMFGHIHQYQKLSDKTYVVGSPMSHNFGDIGDRGVLVIDFDKDEIEFVPLKFPKFVTVNKLEDWMVNDRENYYRVETGKVKSEGNILGVGGVVEIEERLKGKNLEEWIKEYVQLKQGGLFEEECGLKFLKDVNREFELIPKDWKVIKVGIKNFQSIEDVEYKIGKAVTVVIGEGDEFQSNGTGKTSLFDGLMWGLFGETTKGMYLDEVVNRNVGKNCRVKITLEKDGHKLDVIRYRKDKSEGNSLKVVLDDGSLGGRSSDMQEILERELGFTKDVFLNVVYFSQEKLKMLSEMTDVERQGFLGKLLGLEQLELLRKNVKETQKDVSYSKLRLEGDIESFDSRKIRLVDELNSYLSQKEAKDLLIKKDKDNLEVEIKKVEGKLEVLEEENKQLKEESVKVEEEIVSDVGLDSLEMDYREKSTEVSLCDGNIRELLEDLDKLSNLKVGEFCNYCGSKITVDNVDKYKDRILKEVEKFKKKKFGLEKEEVVLKQKYESEKKSVEEKIVEQRKERNELWKKVEECNERKIVVNRKYVDLKSELKELTEDKGLGALINRVEREIGEIGQLRADNIEKLSRIDIELEICNFWLEGFGKSGIPALLLDRFCNMFNKKVNYYLSIISGGVMNVMLSSRKKLKSGEMRDKVDILVTYRNDICSYNSLSGGERKRVDIALMLALDNVIRNSFKLKNRLLGILIMDEVFGFLDKDGEEGAAQILVELGYDCAVFVVSHSDELINWFPQVWVVKKEKGLSNLKKVEYI